MTPRARLSAILVCLLILLAQGAVLAQQDENRQVVRLHMEAFNTGDQYWFKLQDASEKNPTLTIPPGARVEVTLKNVAHVGHNIRFDDPINRALPILDPGRQDTLTFDVPANASGRSGYWCEPHRSFGMQGEIAWGAEESRRTPSPWVAAVLAVSMAALLPRTRSA